MWMRRKKPSRRRYGRDELSEMSETNSSMMQRRTSTKRSLALQSVLGVQGDGWRILKEMRWHCCSD